MKNTGESLEVLGAMLDKYANKGIRTLRIYFLRVKPLRDIGITIEIINLFGSKVNFFEAVREMETQLYIAED